ncbi:MAG: hypothetical protein AB4041_01170 [Microcystaceae cyanobacterium]
MKNVLTLLALCVSLTGVAASVLREEMRCYLGLASQGCPTSEKPTLPLSLPQKSNLEDLKPSKSLSQPKAIEPSPKEPKEPILSKPKETISSPDSKDSSRDMPSQPVEAVQKLDPNPPLRELPVSVEALRKRDLETSKTPETEATESGIPLSVEPYESSP